uniref:Uncharacterized protein n=1 Tax=Meloidogyne incognita TaxID=6306 RepID=A0A914M4X1_MELIC
MSRLSKRRPQCVASEDESAAAIQQQKQQQMGVIPFNAQRERQIERGMDIF